MTRRKLPTASTAALIMIAVFFLYESQCTAFLWLGTTSIRTPSLSLGSDGTRGDFFDELSDPSGRKDLERSQMFSSSSPSDPEAHIPRLNIVTLVGRIGSLQPKYFDDGKVLASLSLAVKRKYHPLERKVKNIKSGDEETDWFNLEVWGRDAEYAIKYVKKGARVGITGSLACDSWVDRNTGDKRHRFKVVVKHLDILESKAEADLRSGGGRKSYYESDDEDNGPYSGGSGSFFDS
jgi:single-strand DNA-binding protein